MKNKHFISTIVAALGLAVSPVSYVHAQDSALEEIIVTAERREASLQETDISMTVLGGKTLQELGISDYTDLQDFAPNVRTPPIPTSAGGAIAIRGFRNGETIGTFEPKVGLYLDGVLIAKNPGSAFDVLDMERIEILRGPQGTLYGRNTVGGAINYITKKPTDEFEGKVSLTYGKYDQEDAKVMFNVPLVGPNGVLSDSTDSRLNLRVSLASLNRDGYHDNNFTGESEVLWDKDRDVSHVQLQYKPNDSLSFLYAYDRTDLDEVNPGGALTACNPVTKPGICPFVTDGGGERNIDFEQGLDVDVEGHSLTINWDLNDNLSLVSISAYREAEDASGQDADSSPSFILNSFAVNESHTVTQELRLVGTAMDSRLQYVGGFFYMDETIDKIVSGNALAGFGILSETTADAENEVWALFGEATYSLTDRLDLTLGLRYTEEDREMSRFDQVTVLSIGFKLPPNVLPDAQNTYENISGTMGITYQWNDDLMTYAKWSRGFVSGGFNPRSPSPDTFADGFDEEEVDTYEIGIKSTWFNNRLQVNGAIFYNDYQDLQVNLLDKPTGRNNLNNAGDADIEGFELEIKALPMENLDIGVNYGYLDTEYKKFIDPNSGADLSNLRWAHAPRKTFSTYGRYVVPGFMSAGDLVLRVDYNWTDEFFLLSSEGNHVSEYNIVNARIALDNIQGPGESTISVALWGRNLGTETYYTTGFDLIESSIGGFATKFTGPPRSYGVDFVVEF